MIWVLPFAPPAPPSPISPKLTIFARNAQAVLLVRSYQNFYVCRNRLYKGIKAAPVNSSRFKSKERYFQYPDSSTARQRAKRCRRTGFRSATADETRNKARAVLRAATAHRRPGDTLMAGHIILLPRSIISTFTHNRVDQLQHGHNVVITATIPAQTCTERHDNEQPGADAFSPPRVCWVKPVVCRIITACAASQFIARLGHQTIVEAAMGVRSVGATKISLHGKASSIEWRDGQVWMSADYEQTCCRCAARRVITRWLAAVTFRLV